MVSREIQTKLMTQYSAEEQTSCKVSENKKENKLLDNYSDCMYKKILTTAIIVKKMIMITLTTMIIIIKNKEKRRP